MTGRPAPTRAAPRQSPWAGRSPPTRAARCRRGRLGRGSASGERRGSARRRLQDVGGGNDNARTAPVEVDPVHPAARYHGADRSIRSAVASASSAVGGSPAASAASATSCWGKVVVWAEWRRSWSVTHLESGTPRLSMIGTTSSGTLNRLVRHVRMKHTGAPRRYPLVGQVHSAYPASGKSGGSFL